MANTKNNNHVRNLTNIALLSAVIFVISYLPRIAPSINWTLATIPVVIGAILMGPVAGGVLGGVWGMVSFFQVFGLLGLPQDPSGPILFGISPVFTIILCFVPRIVVGVASAWCFIGLRKIDKTKFISYLVTCIVAPLLNTVLFLSTLVLFFWNSAAFEQIRAQYSSAFAYVFAIASVNALVEVVTCAVIGTAVAKGVHLALLKSRRSY